MFPNKYFAGIYFAPTYFAPLAWSSGKDVTENENSIKNDTLIDNDYGTLEDRQAELIRSQQLKKFTYNENELAKLEKQVGKLYPELVHDDIGLILAIIEATE